MKHCLVTGGAGFIGSHLVEGLLEKGCRVRVLDDFSSGRRAYLPEAGSALEIVEGDVRDAQTVQEAVRGVDTVFHQAALASVPRSVEDPWATHDVNVNGTLRLLAASAAAKVQKFVVAASSAAYGDSPELPKRETMVPRPQSPYGASKLAQEQYATAFYGSFGMETVALRYFNVFGPRQAVDSPYAAAIPRFFAAALAQRPAQIFGDGEQTRDFVFVADVVRANLMAAQAPRTHGAVLNVAGGRGISVRELETEIRRLCQSPTLPEQKPERRADIRHSVADVSLIESTIGWKAHVSLQEGLRQSLAWYQANREI